MTSINQREANCPYCGENVTLVEVMSFSIAEKDSDFFPEYMGANPLPVMVETCPHCSFTGYTSDFDAELTEKEKHKLDKTLKKIHTDKLLTPAEKYKNLALIYNALDKTAVEIGNCYLKAAWCERLEESEENELPLLHKALNYFELGLKASEVIGNEELVIRYLIGEIFRRLGENEKALKYWTELQKELSATEKDESWLSQWIEEGLGKM